jgi:hypothetical protein
MKKIVLFSSILFSFNAIAQNNGIAQNDTVLPKKQDTVRIGDMVIVGGNVNNSQSSRYRSNKRNNSVIVYSKNDTLLSVNDDTVRVGRINIINKSEGSLDYGTKNWESVLDGDFKKTKISIEKSPKKLKPIENNWWILDLGFANYINEAPSSIQISGQPNASVLKLNNGKSSNVNIWILQQKVNLYNHQLNLKYGIGFEMFNFRFDQPISFRNDIPGKVKLDDINFTKNKLYANYLTVPLQLNFNPSPMNRKGFYASIGMSAGYLIGSKNKQISEERGKRKETGNFNLNDIRFATIGELGIGGIRIYGSYGLTNLFNDKLTNLNVTPYTVGFRFSRF